MIGVLHVHRWQKAYGVDRISLIDGEERVGTEYIWRQDCESCGLSRVKRRVFL